MEHQPTEEFESNFVTTFLRDKEVSVPFFADKDFVDSMNKTASYVQTIIAKNNLQKLSEHEITICNIRWIEELGWHYWVHLWERPH